MIPCRPKVQTGRRQSEVLKVGAVSGEQSALELPPCLTSVNMVNVASWSGIHAAQTQKLGADLGTDLG